MSSVTKLISVMILAATIATENVALDSAAAAAGASTSISDIPITMTVTEEWVFGPFTHEQNCLTARALWNGPVGDCFDASVFGGKWYFVGY
ncbi:hypothetical protein [Amycolatopsis sp. cmx-11-51]|uniref:hypothetical protein n=1 Tax=unclassified Amycolatopsis TaxID=2618356 RepID=UPI0039E691F9